MALGSRRFLVLLDEDISPPFPSLIVFLAPSKFPVVLPVYKGALYADRPR